MSDTVFIYALCEPGTRRVRYIGKTHEPADRLRAHMLVTSTKHTHVGHWLAMLKESGQQPEMVIIRSVPLSEWQHAEQWFIRNARALGCRLCNASIGGEGIVRPTPEHLANLRAARARQIISDDTRARMSESAKLRYRSPEEIAHVRSLWVGKRHKEETKEKMRAYNRSRILTEEQLARIRAPRKGVPLSPEHRAKLRAARLGMKRSPESRAKQSASQTGRKLSPEHCAKIRAIKLAYYAAKRLSQSTTTQPTQP